MNRYDFQKLALLRIKEAEVLLKNNCYHGAYYLSGYSIECALKACVSKKTKKYEFPDRKTVADSYTHDLSKLLRLSGLERELDKEMDANRKFAANWNILKEWKEDSRYSLKVKKSEAENIVRAITHSVDGVLLWLKKHW